MLLNSVTLKMKAAVMVLYYQPNNGLKKQMPSALFRKPADMVVEHLHIKILLLNLVHGFHLSLNTI
jgi:hypothetical protein